MTNRPLATTAGLTSYRYKCPFGPIMIGATDSADALNEAKRSLSSGEAPDIGLLEVWNGEVWEAARDPNCIPYPAGTL